VSRWGFVIWTGCAESCHEGGGVVPRPEDVKHNLSSASIDRLLEELSVAEGAQPILPVPVTFGTPSSEPG